MIAIICFRYIVHMHTYFLISTPDGIYNIKNEVIAAIRCIPLTYATTQKFVSC